MLDLTDVIEVDVSEFEHPSKEEIFVEVAGTLKPRVTWANIICRMTPPGMVFTVKTVVDEIRNSYGVRVAPTSIKASTDFLVRKGYAALVCRAHYRRCTPSIDPLS